MTADSGPFAGEVTGTRTVTLGEIVDPELAAEEAALMPLKPGAIERQTFAVEYRRFETLQDALDVPDAGIRCNGAALERPDDEIAWPDFVCDTPLFGRLDQFEDWRQPDAKSVHFALDKSEKDGDLYDVLYLDLNGNLRIDEGERFRGEKANVLPEEEPAADFGIIKRPETSGAPRRMEFRVWAGKNDWAEPGEVDTDLYSVNMSYMGGTIVVAGEEQPIRFYDDDEDGTYLRYGADTVGIGLSEPVRASRVFKYRGIWLDMEIDEPAQSVTIGPYTGRLGAILCEADTAAGSGVTANLSLFSEDGMVRFLNVRPGKPTEAPPAEYDSTYVSLRCDYDGETWSLSFSDLPIRVRAGETTTLRLGKPLTAEIHVTGTCAPGEEIGFDYALANPAGGICESIATWGDRSEYEEVSPALTIKNSAGDIVAEGVLEPG